jgi:RNase adaptor protein for sRNA GlmZ degradation
VQCLVETCRVNHVVVCGCKSGRHRSVVTSATARLLLRSLGHQTYNNLLLRLSTNPGVAHVISSLL